MNRAMTILLTHKLMHILHQLTGTFARLSCRALSELKHKKIN